MNDEGILASLRNLVIDSIVAVISTIVALYVRARR